jgi:hypothetical protein
VHRSGERLKGRQFPLATRDYHLGVNSDRIRAMSLAGSLAAVAAVFAAGCGLLPTTTIWQVDAVNTTDRPLLVTITTDRGGMAWRLVPGAEAVLLREVASVGGNIELIDPADCTLYDSAPLTGSVTISPFPVLGGDVGYRLGLVSGAGMSDPVNREFFGGCSG